MKVAEDLVNVLLLNAEFGFDWLYTTNHIHGVLVDYTREIIVVIKELYDGVEVCAKKLLGDGMRTNLVSHTFREAVSDKINDDIFEIILDALQK